MLTKLYQIVDVEKSRVMKTFRTENECEEFMDNSDYSDVMSDMFLTIRPVWTNMSEAGISKLLK